MIHEIYKASETGRQKKETNSLVKVERIVHGRRIVASLKSGLEGLERKLSSSRGKSINMAQMQQSSW